MNEKRRRINAEKRHRRKIFKLGGLKVKVNIDVTIGGTEDEELPPPKSDFEKAYQAEVEDFYDAGYPLDDIVDEIARENAEAYAIAAAAERSSRGV